MKKLLLCLPVFLFQLYLSAQCLLVEVPFQQRTNASSLIIEGRVIDNHSFWNEDHTMIYTSNRVEVLKIFKGRTLAGTIDILTEGGIVGLDKIIATPSLSLKKEEIGIFMCEPATRFKALPASASRIPRLGVYAGEQGFVKYDLLEQTASDHFKKYTDIEKELYEVLSPSKSFIEVKPFTIHANPPVSQRIQAISGFSPATVTAGTGTVLTINGNAFGATQGSGTVGFRNGDDGGATYINPLPSQYLSWSNTQITVQVPSGAATGTIQVTQGATSTSAGTLTVSYSHLNVDFDPGPGTIAYQTDHVNDNGTGGYTWRMNTGFDANAAARASFLRAFDSWRCGTDVNWTIGATTAINDAVSDGFNVICFDNTAPLTPGILGACYSYWSGCASGPTIVWYVNELDIIFDEGSNIAPLTWQFGPGLPTGSQYDFETVAVHELGHGHQLGHVISPGAIMHFALGNGVSNRSLGANDLAGGNFVQAKSEVANVCGSGAMTAFTGCVLPLTITSLKAYQRNNIIQVEWINESESDVDHYEIEKSADGIAFTSVASVLPKTNNHTRADYEWPDTWPNNGTNLYRIKSVGHSGRVEYTVIVSVTISGYKQGFSIYPNPVKANRFTAEMNRMDKGVYTLSLYNTAGQQVLSKTIVHNGGNAAQSIPLPNIAAGVYHLKLKGSNTDIRQSIVIGKND
jgi:hypothetical protein